MALCHRIHFIRACQTIKTISDERFTNVAARWPGGRSYAKRARRRETEDDRMETNHGERTPSAFYYKTSQLNYL